MIRRILFLFVWMLMTTCCVMAQEPDTTQPIGPDTSPLVERDHRMTLSSSFGPTAQVFLMPTANPIGAGHGFLSDNELLFFYGGVGIGDYLSLTAGATTVPIIGPSNQLYTTQLKASVAEAGAFNMALGLSASWMTTTYYLWHGYLVTTFMYDTTWWITGMLFYKIAGQDYIDLSFGKVGDFAFPYLNPFGFAIGAETRVAGRSDMRIVGEFWNNGGAAFMLGIRFGNDLFDTTFGVVIPGSAFPVPVSNFVWRW